MFWEISFLYVVFTMNVNQHKNGERNTEWPSGGPVTVLAVLCWLMCSYRFGQVHISYGSSLSGLCRSYRQWRRSYGGIWCINMKNGLLPWVILGECWLCGLTANRSKGCIAHLLDLAYLMPDIHSAIFGCRRPKMTVVKESWQYLWSWLQNGVPTAHW